MPNKKINQLDVKVAVSTDLMLVGDPSTGTSFKSTVATLPLVPYTGATGAVSLGLFGLTAGTLTLQPQALNSSTYKITQQMASNDSWSIYGYATIADYGDLYFELQDNAAFADGQRFRFYYGNASSGTPKDILLMDYNGATFDGTLVVNKDATINTLTIGKGLAALSHNTALGYQSLFHVTTGNYNTAAGYQSLHNISTGQYNTALGQSSMFTATTAAQNVAIGLNALLYTTSGGSNVVMGVDGLQHNTTGASNVALGYNAGSHITGGSTPNTTSGTSIYIGRDTKAAADGQSNQIVIGYQTTGLGSNTTVIGNSSTTDAAIYGRLLVNYSSPVIGTYALDVNGTARVSGSALITGVLQETITTNRQTASYSLVLADRGKLVEMNVASANTLTIPLNSSVAFPIGTKIDVTQYGAGATTITATGGVTIRSFTSFLKIAGQYAACTLVKIGTDEWYAYGNLIA